MPDSTRAMQDFQIEVAKCLQTLADMKLAHSIAHAVATDGPVIANLIGIEVQAEQDRKVALQTSIDDPELESPADPPPKYEDVAPSTNTNVVVQYWEFQDTINEGATSSRDSQGPTYSKCQETALKTFSSPSMICCTCYEHFRPSDAIRLKCNDIFCRQCLRGLVLTSLEDKTLFPPKCHREALSQQMIAGLLSQDELADFKDTEIEMSCSNRTYCSNSKCGKFIPPPNITADRASCARCRWLEENIIDRAEEVVDREAEVPLRPQERQRRVNIVRQELLDTDECIHPGKFERIFGGSRRGFRCEMCDNRHRKYILQCRRCHLRVCEGSGAIVF